MGLKNVSLELLLLLEFLGADLARIASIYLDLDVFGTLFPTISHMRLGVSFILELLLAAWTLPIIFSK